MTDRRKNPGLEAIRRCDSQVWLGIALMVWVLVDCGRWAL